MDSDFIKYIDILKLFRTDLSDLYSEVEASDFFFHLTEEDSGMKKIQVHATLETPVPAELLVYLLASLEKLKNGEPIQYIIGKVDFSGAKINVRPGVLIPRPETEELVGLIFRENMQLVYNNFSLLDIGTGSGCIPVSLKRKFPDMHATGIDLSEEALEIARENAKQNDVDVDFRKCNILDHSEWNSFSVYDIIVSNPPYVPESDKKHMRKNVLEYEPEIALFVTDDDPLLFYRNISEFAFRHLSRPGILYFEIHESFGQQIRKLTFDAGFEKSEIIRDFHGKDRFIRAEVKLAMADQSYWHVEH